MKRTKLLAKPVILFLMTLLMLSFSKVPSANAFISILRRRGADAVENIGGRVIADNIPLPSWATDPFGIWFWILLGIGGLIWLFEWLRDSI